MIPLSYLTIQSVVSVSITLYFYSADVTNHETKTLKTEGFSKSPVVTSDRLVMYRVSQTADVRPCFRLAFVYHSDYGLYEVSSNWFKAVASCSFLFTQFCPVFYHFVICEDGKRIHQLPRGCACSLSNNWRMCYSLASVEDQENSPNYGECLPTPPTVIVKFTHNL